MNVNPVLLAFALLLVCVATHDIMEKVNEKDDEGEEHGCFLRKEGEECEAYDVCKQCDVGLQCDPTGQCLPIGEVSSGGSESGSGSGGGLGSGSGSEGRFGSGSGSGDIADLNANI